MHAQNGVADLQPKKKKAMAEARAGPSGPPPEKAKNSTPLSKVTAEARASQFAEDFHSDSGILFSFFCDHCVDYTTVNTIKDHRSPRSI